MSSVLQHNSVREALREDRQGLWGELYLLLKVVRAQVNLLRPAFWVASALIVFLGCLLVLSEANLGRALVLQIIGPLLCYLGAASVFRGIGLNVLEFELACPPSPRQITVARMIIVLGYDLILGLVASLILSLQGNEGIMALTLHWVAPLFLVFGLTLLLSLRIPIHYAAMFSYTGWLALLILAMIGHNGIQSSISTFSTVTELGFGASGLVMMGTLIIFLPKAIAGLLPGKPAQFANF